MAFVLVQLGQEKIKVVILQLVQLGQLVQEIDEMAFVLGQLGQEIEKTILQLVQEMD